MQLLGTEPSEPNRGGRGRGRMDVNYYKILQVDRKSNNEDLKKAYRKLAMKWHPDKNPNNEQNAEAKMKKISEAYRVLSDPQRRVVYDQLGEDGLKGQTPMPYGSCSNHTPPAHAPNEFFGFSDPFRGLGADPRATAYGISSGLYGSLRRGAARTGPSSYMRKGPAVERTLRCSLEDLYMGSVKRMKVARDVLDDIGRPSTAEESKTIDIKRGWKKGTTITFQEMGNQQSRVIPSDLVLTIDEIPHRVFKRDGNDLITTLDISLVEALTGYTTNLTTLDGRNLTIPIASIIGPTYEEVVKGEGMPILEEPLRNGNLRIKFNIKFPIKLTPDQRMSIQQLLTSS